MADTLGDLLTVDTVVHSHDVRCCRFNRTFILTNKVNNINSDRIDCRLILKISFFTIFPMIIFSEFTTSAKNK